MSVWVFFSGVYRYVAISYCAQCTFSIKYGVAWETTYEYAAENKALLFLIWLLYYWIAYVIQHNTLFNFMLLFFHNYRLFTVFLFLMELFFLFVSFRMHENRMKIPKIIELIQKSMHYKLAACIRQNWNCNGLYFILNDLIIKRPKFLMHDSDERKMWLDTVFCVFDPGWREQHSCSQFNVWTVAEQRKTVE